MLGHDNCSGHWFAARHLYADDGADRRPYDSAYVYNYACSDDDSHGLSYDASAYGVSQQHPHATPDDGSAYAIAFVFSNGRTYCAFRQSIGDSHCRAHRTFSSALVAADAGTHGRIFLRIFFRHQPCIG